MISNKASKRQHGMKILWKKLTRMQIKSLIKKLLKHTPFYPVHIGAYIRNLYFWRFIKKLPIEKFVKILDAGCGGGECARKLAIKYPHLKINAYDIEKYASWNDRPNNVYFKQKNLLRLEEEECYDFVLCVDVLEHIPENHKVLGNIYRALKLGGYFYLHMPSKVQKRIFPERFFREFNNWARKEHIGEMYTLEELKEVMSTIGFEIVEACKTFGFFGKIAWEIDRIVDKNTTLKTFIMPLLKLFACFDLYLPKLEGNGILILARKRIQISAMAKNG